MVRNNEMELCKKKINDSVKFGSVSFTGRDILKESLNIKPIITKYVEVNLPLAVAYPIFDLSFIRNNGGNEQKALLDKAEKIIRQVKELGEYILIKSNDIHDNIPAIEGNKILLTENIKAIDILIVGVEERKNKINKNDFEEVIPLIIENFKLQIKGQIELYDLSNHNIYNDLEEFLESRINVDKIFYDKVNPKISILKDISYECLNDCSFYNKIMKSNLSDEVKELFRIYNENLKKLNP